MEYKTEGLDAEAVAYSTKQRCPDLPVIVLSAFSDIPERILWLVDEYAMNSELPKGLPRPIDRVNAANEYKSPGCVSDCAAPALQSC